jgi:hypothetical protein
VDGFVIVARFLLSRIGALLIWRYGDIDESGGARPQPPPDRTAPPRTA